MGAQPQERVQWGPCASPSTHSLGPNVCTASDCPSLCYPQAPWATCALHCIALTPPPPSFPLRCRTGSVDNTRAALHFANAAKAVVMHPQVKGGRAMRLGVCVHCIREKAKTVSM